MVAVAETAAADPKSKAIKKKKDTKPKRAKLTFLTTDQFYLFSGGWASNWKQVIIKNTRCWSFCCTFCAL